MERQIRRQYTADYKAQAVLLAESLGAAGAAARSGFRSNRWPTGSHWRAKGVSSVMAATVR